MKPASTGCGTNLDKRPTPKTAISTCSRPLSMTVAPHKATTATAPGAEPGDSAGSAASCATRLARISAVADVGPPAGIAARPSRAYRPPPSTMQTKAAATPAPTPTAPSGAKASRPSVSGSASTDSEPTVPPSNSRAQAAPRRRAKAALRAMRAGVDSWARAGW